MLPRLSSDVDPVVADNQQEVRYLALALQAAPQNDAAGRSAKVSGGVRGDLRPFAGVRRILNRYI
jgi:hypothetical protein